MCLTLSFDGFFTYDNSEKRPNSFKKEKILVKKKKKLVNCCKLTRVIFILLKLYLDTKIGWRFSIITLAEQEVLVKTNFRKALTLRIKVKQVIRFFRRILCMCVF